MEVVHAVKSAILSLLKANVLASIVVFFLYLVESNSDYKLFVTHFKWKKSRKYARVFRHTFQAYFFIFCVCIFFYDLFRGSFDLSMISFVVWLILLLTLTMALGKFHDKYQGVDPNKEDDDLSGI
ncbi:MAG: hypothetical protein CL946_07040 [Ectothiorhodospiraceae bacterium]|nr:hypothetical protein [Ectothiorhodospiraceae bacterium]